ncbi:Uncharacterized protein dnm_046020 [Desulfonema magnum]|uniref:Uncharacterized protein n=1 Tax=Desulfonema magnum TaxID=45655 RepID=A0A975BP78_9BACT|nr:Uncharacterized protein dnm_046020 [Desulfonema magnum]
MIIFNFQKLSEPLKHIYINKNAVSNPISALFKIVSEGSRFNFYFNSILFQYYFQWYLFCVRGIINCF